MFTQSLKSARSMERNSNLNFVISSLRKSILPLSLCASISPFLSSTAHAQSADQIVEPSYAPTLKQTPSGGLEIPLTSNTQIPDDANKLFVSVSSVEIQGRFEELHNENAEIISSLSGKKVSAAELFKSANKLESAYIRAGYLLTRVSLPAQEITPNGNVTFIVTDGYIQDIDATALPHRISSQISKILAPLKGKRKLTTAEFERRLLLAGDTPGAHLKTTLSAGSNPGSTRLILQSEFKPFQASLSANSNVSKSLGEYSTALSVHSNSLLGRGDAVYGYLSGYPTNSNRGAVLSSTPRNRQLALGVVAPINRNGLTANIEYVDSRTNPTSEIGISRRDHYRKFSTRFSYDGIRSRTTNHTTTLSLDVVEQDQYFVLPEQSILSSKDGLTVLRFSQNAQYLFENSQLYASASFSKGLDLLVSRKGTTLLPTGRQNTDPEFEKMQANVNYRRSLLDGRVVFAFETDGQYSFGTALSSSEQLTLTGPDKVSGYASGRVTADTGVISRAELANIIQIPSRPNGISASSIMPYVYGTAAYSKLEAPTAVEFKNETINSVGIGARAYLKIPNSDHDVSINLEYGRAFSDRKKKGDRVNFRITASF